jgi:glycosyltransferase involved in cell wall biosynthesis
MHVRLRVLTDPPSVSVVVASGHGANRLKRCLESIAALSYPRFETIVVDGRREHCGRMASRRRPGAARGRGVAAATGDLVAAIGDDVTVDRDWLGAIAEAFARPEVGCVTGLTMPGELPAGGPGTGANVAFRADVLRRLGRVDPATDMDLASHGSTELIAHVEAVAGYAIAYQPAAIVWQHRTSARTTACDP